MRQQALPGQMQGQGPRAAQDNCMGGNDLVRELGEGDLGWESLLHLYH